MDVSEHAGGALAIYGPGNEKRFIRTIEISGKSRTEILNEVINLYELGADEIDIHGKLDREIRRSIHDAIQFVIGLQIISESPTKLILKSVLNSGELSFVQCLRSMSINAKSMFEDGTEAFLSGDTQLAKEVIDRDTEVDKLYHLIVRNHQSLLQDKATEGNLDLPLIEANAFEYLATQIERIADHAVQIAAFVAKNRTSPIDSEIATLMARLSRRLEKVFTGLIEIKKFEKNAIVTLLEENASIKNEIDTVRQESIKRQFWEGLILLNSFERVSSYLENILEKHYQLLLFPRTDESSKNS